MHSESKQHMRRLIKTHISGLPPGRVLDIGAMGKNPHYRRMWEPLGWHYTGLDMAAGHNVDLVLDDPWMFPMADNSFDAICSGQMLEHNEMFWLSFMEMNRVLKMGGVMIHIAPSRGYEHRAPQDCWRFYRDGMTALAKWSGFEVIEASTDWAPEHLEYFQTRRKSKLPHIHRTMHLEGTTWGDCVGVFRKTHEARDSLGMAYMRKFTKIADAERPHPAQRVAPESSIPMPVTRRAIERTMAAQQA